MTLRHRCKQSSIFRTMCLEPYQASVVELFCGNREWFLADKNFTVLPQKSQILSKQSLKTQANFQSKEKAISTLHKINMAEDCTLLKINICINPLRFHLNAISEESSKKSLIVINNSRCLKNDHFLLVRIVRLFNEDRRYLRVIKASNLKPVNMSKKEK